MDTTVRGGCAARSVIAVSMRPGPPVIAGVRRPRDGTTQPVPLSRLRLVVAVLAGIPALLRDRVDEALGR